MSNLFHRFSSFFILICAVCLLPNAGVAQLLEWKSLGGPKNTDGHYQSLGRIIATSQGPIFFFGAGLYRSDSRGATWTKVSNAHDIAFDKDSILYAAGSDGVFSSTNFGTTWKSLNDQLPTATFNCIAITPKGTLIVCTSYSIYRSTDVGVTWDHVAMNIPIASGNMQMTRTQMGDLVANFDYKSYRSVDDGVTWKNVKSSVAFFVAVSPTVLITGYQDGAITRSTDDGNTWNQVLIPAYSTYTFGMPAMDMSGTLYMGSSHYSGDGVVLFSKDTGLTWQWFGTCPDVFYLAFGQDNEAYAGTYQSGLFRSLKPVDDVHMQKTAPQSLQAFPNPASNTLHILSDLSLPNSDVPNSYVVIADMEGRQIASQTGASWPISFDLSAVPNGPYLCISRTGKQIETVNLTVQH